MEGKRIRTHLMNDEGDDPLSGDVEIDETSWGGKPRRKLTMPECSTRYWPEPLARASPWNANDSPKASRPLRTRAAKKAAARGPVTVA